MVRFVCSTSVGDTSLTVRDLAHANITLFQVWPLQTVRSGVWEDRSDAKGERPTDPVAKVDATKAGGLGSRFEVSGYPTIKILKKGEPVDYDGDRNERGECI